MQFELIQFLCSTRLPFLYTELFALESPDKFFLRKLVEELEHVQAHYRGRSHSLGLNTELHMQTETIPRLLASYKKRLGRSKLLREAQSPLAVGMDFVFLWQMWSKMRKWIRIELYNTWHIWLAFGPEILNL